MCHCHDGHSFRTSNLLGGDDMFDSVKVLYVILWHP